MRSSRYKCQPCAACWRPGPRASGWRCLNLYEKLDRELPELNDLPLQRVDPLLTRLDRTDERFQFSRGGSCHPGTILGFS